MEKDAVKVFHGLAGQLKRLGHKDVRVVHSWRHNTDYVVTSSSSAGIEAELRTNRDTGSLEVILWNQKGLPQREITDVDTLNGVIETFSA